MRQQPFTDSDGTPLTPNSNAKKQFEEEMKRFEEAHKKASTQSKYNPNQQVKAQELARVLRRASDVSPSAIEVFEDAAPAPTATSPKAAGLVKPDATLHK